MNSITCRVVDYYSGLVTRVPAVSPSAPFVMIQETSLEETAEILSETNQILKHQKIQLNQGILPIQIRNSQGLYYVSKSSLATVQRMENWVIVKVATITVLALYNKSLTLKVQGS